MCYDTRLCIVYVPYLHNQRKQNRLAFFTKKASRFISLRYKFTRLHRSST